MLHETRPPPAAAGEHVRESRFGVWFLGTTVWTEHVLSRAIADLERLIGKRKPVAPVLLDVGCGWGRSFGLLHRHFAPQRLIGVDVDPAVLEKASAAAAMEGLEVDLRQGSSSQLPVADRSVDLLFCHQTFHHLVDQDSALREFRRVLKPGGLLLFAESTRAYIHSWIIRLLFRHPMHVQKSAREYLDMIRAGGFDVDEDSVSLPYLWWSRTDLGIRERWFGIRPAPDREETLINLVAVRR
ncbi:MAG: class I SAM-dependent methyltransferase [Panacagrimonas sp.]